MAYDVDFVPAFDADLSSLREGSPGRALWLEVIDLIYDDDCVANELTINRGHRDVQPRFDTVPVQGLQAQGFNIWRLKLYRADRVAAFPQRLLYALDHGSARPCIWLLALMPRREDYDQRSAIIQRVLNDYERLGIPRVFRA